MRIFLTLFLTIFSSSVFAQSMDFEVMAKQWVKLSNHKFIDERQLGIWFLQVYMSSTYNHVKNDEFEYNDAIEDATIKAKAWFDDVSTDYIYDITTTVQIGKYDFKTQSFPLDVNLNTTFFNQSTTRSLPGLASLVSLHFNSNDKIQNLSFAMPKEEAKAFIASRKNAYGNINRNVYLEIKAKVVSADPIKKINYSEYMPLNSEIISLEVFDQETNKLIGKII